MSVLSLTPLQIRTRLGWTQTRMAEELGCHQSTVSRVELQPAVMNGMLKRAYERVVEAHGIGAERLAS